MVSSAIIVRSEINDVQWNEFIQNSPQNCVFLNSWYLDAVCETWMAIVVTKNNQWVAVMPLNSKSKLGIHYLLQPLFAQFMGVVYAGDLKSHKRPFENEKVILKSIITSIPESAKLINFNFHPSIQYLLPFHWVGYDVQVRYTYWLTLNETLETIQSKYSKSLKNELNLSVKHRLTCKENDSIEELTKILKNREIITEEGVRKLKNIWKYIHENRKGYVLHALDETESIVGAAAFIKDKNRLIYFQGSAVGNVKNGANTFLIDQAISRSCADAQIEYFDFEGSMIESIEHYFRSFKPTLKTYYSIQKNNLPSWVKMSIDLKNRLKGS